MRMTSTRRRLGAGALIAGAVLVALGAFAPTAQAEHATGVAYEGNIDCADLELPFEFKIEGWADGAPPEGDYTNTPPNEFKASDSSDAPAGLTITIDNVIVDDVAKTVTFDWAASTDVGPLLINTLLVKVGNGGLQYDYDPAVSEDTGVVSPKDSVSHLTFCWGGADAQVEETTTTLAAETEADAEVKGVVITAPQELPRTGRNDGSLFLIGMGLVTIGAVCMITRREVLVRS